MRCQSLGRSDAEIGTSKFDSSGLSSNPREDDLESSSALTLDANPVAQVRSTASMPRHAQHRLCTSRSSQLLNSCANKLHVTAGCGCCTEAEVAAKIHDSGPVLYSLHALQHGPRQHEHCNSTHVEAIRLGFCKDRPGSVVLLLVSLSPAIPHMPSSSPGACYMHIAKTLSRQLWTCQYAPDWACVEPPLNVPRSCPLQQGCVVQGVPDDTSGGRSVG